MELLSKEEARKLFLDKLGRDVFDTPDLKVIAEEVLERCAQLPLAIVTIAASFKCLIHDFEWRDALEDLKTSVKGSNNIEAEMHDLVRDMVLRVASPQFKVEGHLGLEDFSDEGKWREDLVKASLMYNNISRIPPNASPMCPKLSTLLLQGLGRVLEVKACAFISKAYKIKEVRPWEYRNYGSTSCISYFSLNDMKLEEVASLKNLETFGGRFSDMYEFSTYMEKGQLATYEIHVGSIRDLAGSMRGKKVVLASCNISRGEESFVLPKDVHDLEIAQLKEKDASAQVPPHTFSRLKIISIYFCSKVKEAASAWVAATPAQPGRDLRLQLLKILNLQSLSELKSICSSSKVISCDSIEEILITRCPKLKRLPLSLPLLEWTSCLLPLLLNEITAEEEWWESLEWDCQDTKNVLQPFFRKGEVSGFRASLKGRDSREPIRVELSLEGLGLSAVPSEVWESGEVIKVNLSRNAIQELPVELSSCISLQTLVLSRNKIKDWPGAILKSLPNLSCLKLDNNPLGQIPADGFQAVSRVQVLDLSGNAASLPEHPVFSSIPQFARALPEEFQHLTSLTELDLSDNNIAVLPPELGLLEPNLQALRLDGNPLRSLQLPTRKRALT
uniref:Uncharacterized protein n=1 Tax=Fagus sylvatica TaxID=28930 RepID=A0A2N9IE65_FAGSY